MNRIISVTQQNFDMEEDNFNFSTHSLHISINNIFLLSCGLWWKASVSRVKLPVHLHNFVRGLELAAWESHKSEHTFVNQKWCECSYLSFTLLPAFLLPWVYLQIHRAISGMFSSFGALVTTMKQDYLFLRINFKLLFCKHIWWQFSFLYNQTPKNASILLSHLIYF